MPKGCEVLFGDAKAARVQELVESATGELCPCKQGLTCPLITGEVVLVPTIRTRVA